MNITEKLKRLDEKCKGYYAERVVGELMYLYGISSGVGNQYDASIEKACDYLYEAIAEEGTIGKSEALYVENMLSEYKAAAKQYTGYCVSHAHIDMNWKWGFQETVAVTVETFITMLRLMDEYPDFKFSQSQASVYRIIEEYAPELLPKIKKRVHEGRWEVTASTWTECDKNMPSGESLSRHILYTSEYLSKLLDIHPDSLDIDFEPDTFGHNANIPEILASGGVKYYYHCRGCDYRAIYNWLSPSGKSVLVYQEPKWYNDDIKPSCFRDYPYFCRQIGKNGVPIFLKLYGVGDHGGGPTRRDIERIIDMNTWPLFPNLKFSTLGSFFREIEKYRDELPEVKEELNYVFTGCYTTQSRIKMANRLSEARLYDAELLNTYSGLPGHNNRFFRAWERVLFSQFHDILPGSCVRETREYAMGQFAETLAYANTELNAACHEICNSINTESIAFDGDISETVSEGGGVGYNIDAEHGYNFSSAERGRGKTRVYHVFNTTDTDRSEVCELTLFDYSYDVNNVIVTDADGREVPHKFTDVNKFWKGHRLSKLLILADVDAFGYTPYVRAHRDKLARSALGFSYRADPRRDHMGDDAPVLENEFVRAVFDPGTLEIISFTDKESGKELIGKNTPSAFLQYADENSRYGMSAWRVGQLMKTVNLNRECNTEMTSYDVGALRSVLSYRIFFKSSEYNVTAALDAHSRAVKFCISIKWLEVGSKASGIPQVSFCLPVSYEAASYRYENSFGTIIREPLAHDVPSCSFIEMIGSDGPNMMLYADTKYGFRGNNNSGSVTLLRSAYDPDPLPESGESIVKLAVCAVRDDTESALISKVLSHPLVYASGLRHGGTLEPRGRFMSVGTRSGDSKVLVSAVKTGEGKGFGAPDAIIVRLYSLSSETESVTLSFDGKIPTAAYLCDIKESITGDAKTENDAVLFEISAHSTVTLKVIF